MNDISIDLETLGVSRNNPVILSIGAVRFDAETGKLGAEFYVEIDLDDAIRNGHIDGSTLRWWFTQAPRARDVFSEKPQKQYLGEALQNLATFVRSTDNPNVWFNGPAEDNAWLKSAYNVFGLDVPWHFTKARDLRTIREAAQLDGTEVKDVGTHHNALDDAKYQALIVCFAVQKINATMKAFGKGGKNFVAAMPGVTTVDDDDEL